MYSSSSVSYSNINGRTKMHTTEIKNTEKIERKYQDGKMIEETHSTVNPFQIDNFKRKEDVKIGIGVVRRCEDDKKIGKIELYETSDNKLRVSVDVNDNLIENGEHGFHLHRCGDEVNNNKKCLSMCEHYSRNKDDVHGGLDSLKRHNGDLGNIQSKEGIIDTSIEMNYTQLSPHECFGRSFIIHSGRDDLGLGGNKESLKTGNAGSRYAYSIIGRLI